MGIDAVDRLPVHLDQATVGVMREARIAGRRGEAGDGLVAETDVEDRVHHPGHRHGRSGTDGDQQRIGRIAEALAGPLLEAPNVIVDLLLEPLREALDAIHVGATCLRRDRETRRDRHAERRHLCEADPLAAKKVTPAVAGLVEGVDVAHTPGIFPQRSSRNMPARGCEPGAFDQVFRRRALYSAVQAAARKPSQTGVRMT